MALCVVQMWHFLLCLLATAFCDQHVDTCDPSEYEMERERGNAIMNSDMDLVPNEPFRAVSKTILLNHKDPDIASELQKLHNKLVCLLCDN